VRDFEIGEFLEIPQFKISDAPNSFPDCLVECDDSAMNTGVSDGEQIDDIFSITGEFLHPVGEGEDSRSDCPIPGDGPVPTILDQFGGFGSSERDFQVTEFLNFGFIMGCGELATEYGVEIDGSSSNDVFPLRIRELGTVGFVNEGSSGCFRINGVGLNEFECF
jgi:hypothetical protein